jgi:D-xylose 1-dehydrogenase
MAIPYTIYPDLREKVVLITGGAEGIGAAAAHLFCRQGSKVIIFDVSELSAKFLIEKISSESKELEAKEESKWMPKISPPEFYEVDVMDLDRLKTAAEQVLSKYGRVDVLVNNAAAAGAKARVPSEKVTPQGWEETMNVNLRHLFFLTQYLVPSMKSQGSGSMINMGSITWRIPAVGVPVYSIAKAAIMGLTKTHSKEFGKYGIRVNSVMPGAIATERQIQEVLTEEYRQEIMDAQSLQRDLKPEEVGKLIVWLGSEESSGVTGSSYVVDGGWVSDP